MAMPLSLLVALMKFTLMKTTLKRLREMLEVNFMPRSAKVWSRSYWHSVLRKFQTGSGNSPPLLVVLRNRKVDAYSCLTLLYLWKSEYVSKRVWRFGVRYRKDCGSFKIEDRWPFPFIRSGLLSASLCKTDKRRVHRSQNPNDDSPARSF